MAFDAFRVEAFSEVADAVDDDAGAEGVVFFSPRGCHSPGGSVCAASPTDIENLACPLARGRRPSRSPPRPCRLDGEEDREDDDDQRSPSQRGFSAKVAIFDEARGRVLRLRADGRRQSSSFGSDPEDADAKTPRDAGCTEMPTEQTTAVVPRCWRKALMSGVTTRDRTTDCVSALYEQYSACLSEVQALRANALASESFARAAGSQMGTDSPPPNSSPRSVTSPRTSPRLAVEGIASSLLGGAAELFLEMRDGPPATSSRDRAKSDCATKQQQELRQKTLTIASLEKSLQHRCDEVQKRDQAIAALSRQATLLARENADLRAQLERAQEQASAQTPKSGRLSNDKARVPEVLREGGLADGIFLGPMHVTDNNIEQRAEARPAMPAASPPERRHISRKVHGGELTCVAAAIGQLEPLPHALLAVGTADGLVTLIDGAVGRPRAQIAVSRDRPRISVLDIAPASSGLILAGSVDQAVRLLDLRKKKQVHTLLGHHGLISACGFLDGSGRAFTASTDRTVRLWDLETGRCLRSLTARCAATAAFASRPSALVLVGQSDGSLATWDTRSRDEWASCAPVHGARGVVGVHMSPCGRQALSQGEDGVVCVTSLESMRTVHSLDGLGPVAGPSRPCFSPDGEFVLARGAARLRCWSAATGTLAHDHEVPMASAVCWDLPEAVSIHRDGHVALWSASAVKE